MSKVVFAGCSFTAGCGWDKTAHGRECKDYPELWVNLCHTRLDPLKELELLNLGQGGASNAEIFRNATEAIATYGSNISVLFCRWTSAARYNFRVGLERWGTAKGKFSWLTDDQKYADKLVGKLRSLHHLHGEILKVVDYSNILQNLAEKFNIKIYFINGICPWDENYFNRVTSVDQFTSFTKKEIINTTFKSNNEILRLYKIMHDEYDQAGGVNTSSWVNLYHSMNGNKIDTNHDNGHPGSKSNQLYFQQIKNFLETQ